MERSRRLTLDNPVFAGNLRYAQRSVAYTRRSLHASTIDDIAAARKPAPRSKHSGVAASKVHTARPKSLAITAKRPSARPARRMRRHRKPAMQHMLLYAMAVTLFMVGIVVSLNGYRANHQVAAQAKQLQKTAAESDAAVAPSTEKPTTAAVANYAVAPSLPRYFKMPQFGIDKARVLPMSVTSTGSLKSPGNVHDVGWYNASATPGSAGAVLLDAHVSSWTTDGVFYHIKDLKPGDTVQVERGDGKVLTYKVVKSQTYAYDKVDMAAAITPVTAGKQGLNMITCAGKVIPGTNEFDQRIVVFAEQV